MTDALTPTWPNVKKWAEAQLEEHRNALEAQQPEEDTATIRGRIAQLRGLLDLAIPKPEMLTGNLADSE